MEYWSSSYRFSFLLDEIKEGDKFLDIGCSVAVPAKLIREKYKDCEIWGTDISDEAIEINKERYPEDKYFQGYVGHEDFLPDNYFDVVFSGEVLEHLDDPALLLAEAYRVLKSGGKFVLTTPNDEGIISSEHVWFFEEDDIRKLYEEAGFKNLEFKKLPKLEHLVVIFAVGVK